MAGMYTFSHAFWAGGSVAGTSVGWIFVEAASVVADGFSVGPVGFDRLQASDATIKPHRARRGGILKMFMTVYFHPLRRANFYEYSTRIDAQDKEGRKEPLGNRTVPGRSYFDGSLYTASQPSTAPRSRMPGASTGIPPVNVALINSEVVVFGWISSQNV